MQLVDQNGEDFVLTDDDLTTLRDMTNEGAKILLSVAQLSDELLAARKATSAMPDLLAALKGFMALGVSHYKTGLSDADKALDELFVQGAKAIRQVNTGAEAAKEPEGEAVKDAD